MKKEINISNILYYFLLLLFWTSLIVYLLVLCINDLPSFDGALNLQIPWQMIEKGKYMTTYDGGKVFDSMIQTRLPVLLPIFVLWKIFGISTVSALLVNAMYIVLLVVATDLICKEYDLTRESRLFITASIVLVPSLFEYGMGIYGEIPSLALLLMSVYFLKRYEGDTSNIKYLAFSGIFIALSILNKTVLLISVPGIAIVMLYKLLKKEINIRSVLVYIVSFCFPIIINELYKMIQLGGLWKYASSVKRELFDVGKQAGVVEGYQDTSNIITKFWKHICILADEASWLNPIFLIILLMIVFFAWITNIIKNKKISSLDIIVIVMFSYFGWWLLITSSQKAWYRRIIIGMILLAIIIGFILSKIINKTKKSKILELCLCLVIVVGASWSMIQNALSTDDESKDDVIKIANYINSVTEDNPNAKFYGVEWWQSPIISLFAQTPFYDIENMSYIENDTYFVVDGYMMALGEQKMQPIFEKYEVKLCANYGTNYVYKLDYLKEENFDFESSFNQIAYSNVTKECYYSKDEYEYITGVHRYEEDNNARWCSTNVELLLLNEGNSRLKIKIHAVAMDKMNIQPNKIYIIVNDKIVDTIVIAKNGPIEYYVEDEIIENDGIKDIRLFTYSQIDNSNDSRELSYLLESIELVD